MTFSQADNDVYDHLNFEVREGQKCRTILPDTGRFEELE